jgi:eukaryotic-like serine/threonine-protein kinase
MTDAARLSAALAERYRLDRELGQGGMATVYLAEDLRHHRQVAIKVLRPELAAVLGADRFVQEITTTAQLQHPHILPLFDSGSADGFLYYVMPYVEGETLRTKLDREKQLGIEEAVKITTEVADALDYAHRHGVIHRDIKPENILLHDGRPMVADFGIALAVSAAAGGRMTETGMSLGTPHYMSPEQATADRDIGPRSDVYSLASVLYETLAGQPPHLGGSAQQIIMKIIAEPVEPVTRYRRSVPPNVAAALARALEKLPADRFESARAFAEALTSEEFSYAPPTPTGTVTAWAPRPAALSWRRRAALALCGAILLALGAAGWGLLHRVPTTPTMQFDLSLGPDGMTPNSDVVISPDGSMLAFSAPTPGQHLVAIYLRHLDGDPDFHLLPGTEGGVDPTFSPDSRWVVFRHTGVGLVKVPVTGGGASTVVSVAGAYFPEWGTPDQIVYTGLPVGAIIVPAVGGTPRRLKGMTSIRNFLLPDGSGVLGTVGGNLVCYDLRTDSMTVLVPGGSLPTYTATGELLYVAEGGLFAVPFDLKSHRLTGPSVRVVNRVGATPFSRGYSVSRSGTLVLFDAPAVTANSSNLLVMHTIGGGADTLPLPPGERRLPRFSPDGRSIAYVLGEGTPQGAFRGDIFTFDLVGKTNPQITFDGRNSNPVWSPDGKRILFTALPGSDSAGQGGLFVKPADNSGEAVRLLSGSGYATDWPREDLTLVTIDDAASGGRGLYTMPPTPNAQPKPYLASPWPEQEAVLSPDGKFAAFQAREKDAWQVWMRDFPTPRGEWLVSPAAGQHPRWSPDGRYIYYWRAGNPLDTLKRVAVTRMPSVVLKPPEVVATINAEGIQNWDLAPDGKRFILVEAASPPRTAAGNSAAAVRYLIFTNWFPTLRAMVEAGRK